MTIEEPALPIPPPDLLSRIGPTPDPTTEEGREFFHSTGRDRKRAIVDLLPDDHSFEGRRVLDFGCGAGRLLRHFVGEAQEAEFWGCDLHAPTIEWLSENLSPPMHFFVNDERPLPQADCYFDLVYGMSVFTHITYDWSDWLLELHRVLKPDGLLLMTFMGSPNWERAAQRPVDEDELGMAVLGLHRDLDDTSGPIVIHSPWWIRTHWGRAFDIRTLRPAGFVDPGIGHGVVLARKRDATLSTDDLERPDPDDPREVAAQRLQIMLLEENAARLGEQVRRQRDRITNLKDVVQRLRGRPGGRARSLGRRARSP
jgi:SAM-dependent methyltransferase